MAVTLSSLRSRFPEFADTPDSLVAGALQDAELLIDRAVFGARADAAVMYYAAHLIAINPLGELAILMKDKKDTTYLTVFKELKAALGAGFRVI